MKFAAKMRDGLKRWSFMRKWKYRLKTLAKAGISQNKFCDTHGFDSGQITRYKTGQLGASWETIEQIEKALTEEGV